MKTIFFLLFVLFLNINANANLLYSSIKGQTIVGCDDDAEWPPFTYFERKISFQPTSTITGLSIDVANEILTKAGAKFVPLLVPWVRCLEKLKKGKEYQFAINASYSPQRSEDYLFSDPVYKTESTYFYYSKYHPQKLEINHLSEIKSYKVCGLFGYNYFAYGLPNKSPNLDTTSKTYTQILEKLKNKTCDLFIEKKEIVTGQAKIGNNLLINNLIQWGKIPDSKDETFHFMITKNWDLSNTLLKVFNNGLKIMNGNGEMKKLRKKYGLEN